jgi:HK97 family phage major capsid protein/HK97 family phage prohead protease
MKIENVGERIAHKLNEIKERGGLKRSVPVGSIDKEARTVEVAFSSETETVERWFGIEVLSHAPGAVDMSRITNGAPVLWMHDWSDQRGVVESARIDGDRKGRAVLRFSRSAEGEQLFQDICDGIISKVSVGYTPTEMKLQEERADGTDVYLVSGWQPYEISMVSIPADDEYSGVGRALENPHKENGKTVPDNYRQGSTNSTLEKIQKMEKVTRDASGNLVRAIVDESGSITQVLEVLEMAGQEARSAQSRGQDAERARVKELTDMGRSYNEVDKALEFIAAGKSADDFRRELLANFATERSKTPLSEQVKNGEVGMNDKEVRQFSVMRAIRALANPNNKQYQKEAAFEFEASRAAAEKAGKESRGIMIPADVLNRAFSVSAGTGMSGTGAGTVATNLLADSFIELLRHRTWALKRVTSLGGLVGNVDIPRQNAATQAYWVGEGSPPTESEPGIDQVSLNPHTLAAWTDITRRLQLQSTPDAERIVRDDLLKVMALALDKAVLYGSGVNGAPKGLLQQNGIHAVALAGANASFSEFVQMETAVAAADADIGSLSYVINAAARGAAKTTLKFPGVNGSQTIWEPGNTINGYEVDVTNQLTAGDNFYGNWSDFILGIWAGLDMTVDPYSLSTSGGTRIVVFQDVDMGIRHAQSFTYASNTATANP